MSNARVGRSKVHAFAKRLGSTLRECVSFPVGFKLWHALVIALIVGLWAGWSQAQIILFVLVGVGLLVLLGASLHTTSGEFKHSLEGLAALLSCMALLAAGYWYFIERRGVPKLNVESTIDAWPIGGGALFVRVETAIENVGTAIISLTSQRAIRSLRVFSDVNAVCASRR